MNPFTLDDLKTLTLQRGGPCVSICLPTHRSVAEMRVDQIRFKNLLRTAEERLIADGLRAPEAKALLEPAHKLEADSQFWRRAGDGMAVFAAGDFFRAYHVPLALEELVVVAHRFDVKPLLPLVRDDSRFYILAVSQNAVRLLLGTHYSVAEITPEALPHGLADAMKYEAVQKDLQYHTVSSPGAGGPQAVFHGHSEGRDGEKDRIGRYFQQVDRGLHRMLHAESVPLVLAGVEYLLPLYRQVNTYPHLLADAIVGNPDGRTAAELHAAAWALVAPRFAQAQSDAVAAYRRWAGTARASNQLEEIVPAAHRGRVETLLVALGTQRWGRYDPDGDALLVHMAPEPDDDDLLDFAGLRTLLTGGHVFTLPAGEMSDDVPLAAVYRY